MTNNKLLLVYYNVQYLKVKVKGLMKAGTLRETFVLPHEVCKGKVPVSTFFLREEHRIVEA